MSNATQLQLGTLAAQRATENYAYGVNHVFPNVEFQIQIRKRSFLFLLLGKLIAQPPDCVIGCFCYKQFLVVGIVGLVLQSSRCVIESGAR